MGYWTIGRPSKMQNRMHLHINWHKENEKYRQYCTQVNLVQVAISSLSSLKIAVFFLGITECSVRILMHIVLHFRLFLFLFSSL